MRLYLLFALLFTSHLLHAQPIVYVSESGTGDGSGTSWSNALPGMLLASRVATAPSGTQFWIKAGTYKPTTTSDRSASFSITSGITIYGGFLGGETHPNQREIMLPTFFSGNIGDPNSSLDNSEQVMRIVNVNDTVTLDQLYIADGRVVPPSQISSGAGLFIEATNSQTTIRIRGCRFEKNMFSRSLNGGGGLFARAKSDATIRLDITDSYFGENEAGFGGAISLYTEGGTLSATIENSQFRNNKATEGGGISARYAASAPGSSLFIKRCSFAENTADIQGGALVTGGLSPQVDACDFQKNYAPHGGAIDLSNSTCRFTNCLFWQNSAQYGGVAAGGTDTAPINASFLNCTLDRNTASIEGSVADVVNSRLRPASASTIQFTNCIAWNNTAPGQRLLSSRAEEGGEAIVPAVTYSIIEGGYPGTGNLTTDPLFVNAADGNYNLRPNSPAIDMGDPATLDIGEKDFGGNMRIRNGRIDIGAYEFQCDLRACTPFTVRKR